MNSIQATGHEPIEAGHIGSVLDVIAARIPPEISSLRLHASHYKLGFELASPKTIDSLGEAVLVNNLCYATSTDPKSSDYNQTIYGEEFVTGGIFLLPPTAKPSHHVQIKPPLSLAEFYDFLSGKVYHPLCFAGIFHFSHLHTIAIGKAPIDGKNIFEHKREYYLHPSQKRENVYAFVIGVLSKSGKELDPVLYRNPLDQESALIHHAHCLILNKKVDHIKNLHPGDVTHVMHLFAEGTEISSGHAEIFTISKLADYAHGVS